MLQDARLMLQSESYRSAVDRAYYAMFHAVRGARHDESVEPPRPMPAFEISLGSIFSYLRNYPKISGDGWDRHFDYGSRATMKSMLTSQKSQSKKP